jgi:hypothetical protein
MGMRAPHAHICPSSYLVSSFFSRLLIYYAYYFAQLHELGLKNRSEESKPGSCVIFILL